MESVMFYQHSAPLERGDEIGCVLSTFRSSGAGKWNRLCSINTGISIALPVQSFDLLRSEEMGPFYWLNYYK